MHSIVDTLWVSLKNELTSFDNFPKLYTSNEDFVEIWDEVNHNEPSPKYLLKDGFLFRGDHLCGTKGSIREHLTREMHPGRLARH